MIQNLIIIRKINLYRNNQWLNTLTVGQHFGQFSLLDKDGRLASAIAETESRVLRIEREDFIEFIRRDPALGVKVVWNILKHLSGAYRELLEQFLVANPTKGDPQI